VINQKNLVAIFEVAIGTGTDIIKYYKGDCLTKLAIQFCKKHNLELENL